MSNRIVNKKQKLLSRKEELLKELKYYETRIEDARARANIPSIYEDDSSDSEIEFTINTGTSVTELKLQRARLLTCLRATEELTGVTVVQSEVNIVLNAPAFEGEAPITEDGLWREVMAECRIDLVTFSMTFYTHQPSRQFAPVSYRGLNVMPTKMVHEKELALSVLPAVTTPSDAVEVLRSYAHAHRSRRSSLARLADKYLDSLFMEKLPEGGYELKCAELLRAAWTLQNKWSQVAPFHHKLTLELEYMDETYVKTIMQAHKQLCNPALDTDGRTLLLAKIIDTCFEARRQIGPDSDADSQNSKTNQKAAVDSQNSKRPSKQEMDAPIKSPDIMGPPTSLPKKSKVKGKQNMIANERKRGSDTDGGNKGTAKKAKTDAKKTNVKDKIDKSSANTKNRNKKSSANENVNSKNNHNEEFAENAYFSKNEPENIDKGNKKAKNLPKVDTESKNTEVLINTDVVKAKDSVPSKSKSSSAKSYQNKVATTRNDKNNDNLKTARNNVVAENELKTKNKPKKVNLAFTFFLADAKLSENKVISVKNDKNNDNLKTTNMKQVTEQELKTKAGNSKSVSSKMISVQKQPANPKDKNIDEENIDQILLTQSVNPNFKTVVTKNLKTKAIVENNEPKTKKSRISVVETNNNRPTNSENIVAQPKNNSEAAESRSKEKGVAENNTQKSDKNVAKQNQKHAQNQVVRPNLVSTKKQRNFDNNVKQNEKYEPNEDLKMNTNNKKVRSEKSSTQSKISNSKNDLQKPSHTQTLAERFSSKNIIETHDIEEKSKNLNRLKDNNKKSNKNQIIYDDLLQNNAKTNNNKEVRSKLQKINQEFNKNVKTKLNSKGKELNNDNLRIHDNRDKIVPKTIEINKNKVPGKQKNVEIAKNMPKTYLNNKPTQIDQKLRKSFGLKKVATKHNTKAETMESKLKAKIPQTRLPIAKPITRNPLRISPRKQLSQLSCTRDSSKSSAKSNIPILLKKPTAKPK